MTNDDLHKRVLKLVDALDAIGLCLEHRDVDILIAHVTDAVNVSLEEAAVAVENTDVELLCYPGAYERPDDGRGTLRSAANNVRALKPRP